MVATNLRKSNVSKEAIQAFHKAMGVGDWRCMDQRYEGVMSDVNSVTRGWGVKFPQKKLRAVTRERPQTTIYRPLPKSWGCRKLEEANSAVITIGIDHNYDRGRS